MKKIKNGFILPSAAYTVPRSQVLYHDKLDKRPEVGDLIYGSIAYIGQHSSLENKRGRIHVVNDGTRAIFVFGNRYAPDYYEGTVPQKVSESLDVLARSGIVGEVHCKNAKIKDPTRVKFEGYVVNSKGNVINTRRYSKINPRSTAKTPDRAKMILVVGTSMNSGKSMTAAACCWALSTMGYSVRGTKVTGTASLKDILLMEDNGAHPVADFSWMGYPSTYMLAEDEVLDIFNNMDLKYGNNPKNYWVVELADGILQRETAMLLQSGEVRSRIHKLLFSAHDAFGAIGGLRLLKDKFDLVPNAISGVCSSSPLGIRELQDFTDLPILDNMQRDLKRISSLLI